MSGPDTAVKRDMQLPSHTKTSHTAECQVTDLKGVSNRGENDFKVLEKAKLKNLMATLRTRDFTLSDHVTCALHIGRNCQVGKETGNLQ